MATPNGRTRDRSSSQWYTEQRRDRPQQQHPRQQQPSPRQLESAGCHDPNPPGKIVCRRCECVARPTPYRVAHFQRCNKRYHKSGRALEPWEANRQGHEQSTGAFKFKQAPPQPQGWTQPRLHAQRAAAIAAIDPAAEQSVPAPAQHTSVDVETLVKVRMYDLLRGLMQRDACLGVPVSAAAPSVPMPREALLDSGSGAHVFASVDELNTARLQVLRSFTGASSVTQGMGTRSISTPSGPVTLSDVALFRAIPSDIVSLGRLIAAGWHFHAVGAADGQINLTSPHGAVVPVVLRRHVLWVPASHIEPVATTVGSASPLADPVRLRQLLCGAVLRTRLRNRIRSAVARYFASLPINLSTPTDSSSGGAPHTLTPAASSSVSAPTTLTPPDSSSAQSPSSAKAPVHVGTNTVATTTGTDHSAPTVGVNTFAPTTGTDHSAPTVGVNTFAPTIGTANLAPPVAPTNDVAIIAPTQAPAVSTSSEHHFTAGTTTEAPNSATTSSEHHSTAGTTTEAPNSALPKASTLPQLIRSRIYALLLSALGWLLTSPTVAPPRSPTMRSSHSAPASSPATRFRLGRFTVPAEAAAEVFHSICNHRGAPVMRAAGRSGTVWPGLPAAFWDLPSSCAACAEANQTAVPVRHNHRSHTHTRPPDPSPERVYQPGHDPRQLRGAEVLACDIVYVDAGHGKPKQKALFVVDVHSTASWLIRLPDKPAAEGALRTVLNQANVTARAYQVRVRSDNDAALVAALTRAAQPFSNVHVHPNPSNDPNCNPAERF